MDFDWWQDALDNDSDRPADEEDWFCDCDE